MPTPNRRLSVHPALVAIREWQGELTEIRRQIHRSPEIGFEEHLTGELVARQLERFGVDEIHRGIGRTGLVAVVRGLGTDSGRSIGLRADMDALPMQEDNDFAHRSCLPGMMHGCGHDGHTTMLLAAARYLAQTRAFDGTAHLIFQPGEEGFAGAQAMIDEGLFDRFPCDQVFAMHNWPALPAGKIAVRPGPMMAAADRITIRIEGRGGHGAHPHLAVDPVAADVFGAHNVVTDLEASMGSEDFSFMLRVRPGAYFRIGQGGAAAGRMLHNSRYDFNDEILPLGGALFARLAEKAMPLQAA